MKYEVELTELEDLAFSLITANKQDWIDNAVHERCRVAIEELVQIAVKKCIETNTSIPQSQLEMINLVKTNNWLV